MSSRISSTFFLIAGLSLAGCFRASDVEIGAQLIKTAPAHDAEWSAAITATKTPPLPFVTKVEFVADPKFSGKTVDEALAALPKDYPFSFVFIADERALTDEGYPCYCVDLTSDGRPRFRVTARHIASVENNLSLANMDFSEFMDAAKPLGVFRGF
ncbi:MAG TPA: hypothetical protein VK477_04215 [Acidobacteriota bacterium]|nr:hypothetical protein [Acidobacteriota bacterium]